MIDSDSHYRHLVAGLLLLLLSASAAVGKERLMRRYGIDAGLEASGLSCLIQDREGFIWVCSERHLVRFDGQEFVPWNESAFTSRPWTLTELPEGGLVFTLQGRHDEGLFTLEGRDLMPWDPGVEPALNHVRDIHVARDGALWIADWEGVRRRDLSGEWHTWPRDERDVFGPYLIADAWDGRSVLVSTLGERVWQVTPGAESRVFYESKRRILHIESLEEGVLFATFANWESRSGIALLRKGELEILHEGEEQGLRGIVRRGEAFWVAANRVLRWHPREGVETNDWRADFVMEDDEGSLWFASRELWQMPEPESHALVREDGLPGDEPTRLVRAPQGLVVAHYAGLAVVDEDGARTIYEGFSPTRPCVDVEGTLWFLRRRSGQEDREDREEDVLWSTGTHRAGSQREYPLERSGWDVEWSCAEDGEGGVFIAHGNALFHAAAGRGDPRVLGPLPGSEAGSADLLIDREGLLWLASQEATCRAPAAGLLAGEADWECAELREVHWVHDLQQAPSGAMWLATGEGLLYFDEGEWLPMPGLDDYPVSYLSLSPSGGVWVPRETGTLRVVEVEGEAGRVEIAETLSRGLGLTSLSYREVHEESDGSLWLASTAGLQHVPGHLRRRAAPRPRVVLVEAPDEAVLPFTRNNVELRFAALSFRDSRSVRYRVRARPEDAWSETRVPEFRFASLEPGRYAAEVIASVDGVSWSEEPARFAFQILPPWYRTWWARLAALLLVGLALYAIYRVRVALLLRLERQRTRIAMDLHDEMGSGLGGIGILSELLAGDDIDESSRVRLAGQISTSARELSASLADIVWALRPRAHSLGALVTRLEVRAHELFPRGEVALEKSGDLDALALSPAVTKNLLSIGSEAIHNAVRHGRPAGLFLRVESAGGRLYRLCVRDDGRGFDPEGECGEGLGLTSMRRRAADIGGRIFIESQPGAGCRVCVEFDPHDQGGATRR